MTRNSSKFRKRSVPGVVLSVTLLSLFFKLCDVFLYIYINLFIYLFLAALGLCCCTSASSSCCERGLLFVVVRGLLIAVASLVAEHRF